MEYVWIDLSFWRLPNSVKERGMRLCYCENLLFSRNFNRKYFKDNSGHFYRDNDANVAVGNELGFPTGSADYEKKIIVLDDNKLTVSYESTFTTYLESWGYTSPVKFSFEGVRQ